MPPLLVGHCRQKFTSLDDFAAAVSTGSLQRLSNVRFTNVCQRPRPSAFNEIGAATGKFLIAREDVHFDPADHVGGGHFGDVYRGTFRGNFVVAVKTLRADDDGGGDGGGGANDRARDGERSDFSRRDS